MLLRVWGSGGGGWRRRGGGRKGLDVRDKINVTREAVKNLPVTALSPALKVTETFLNSTLGKLDKWARVRNERGARVGSAEDGGGLDMIG